MIGRFRHVYASSADPVWGVRKPWYLGSGRFSFTPLTIEVQGDAVAGYVTPPVGERQVLVVDQHTRLPSFTPRDIGAHRVELVIPFVPGFDAVDSAHMAKVAIEIELARIGRMR